MKCEAIIPARGGSKRIPGKNIREFCGKPIIAYSIEAALEAGIFDEVSVSTDSPEIADVAKQYGATVSDQLRDPSLSGDRVLLLDVMKHEALQRKDRPDRATPDALCFILATAPFVTGESIARGLPVLEDPSWDYALAATTYSAPLQRAFRVEQNGSTEMLFEGAYEKFSNDLEEAYHDAGQFYWGRLEKWINPTPGFFGPRTCALPQSRLLSQDIDTEEDWETAEQLFRLTSRKIDTP